MCEREDQESGASGKLSNSNTVDDLCDTTSLSDSDPEDPAPPFDAEVEDLSSSGGESSDETPECRAGPREPLFQLKGASAGFSTRSHSIFDCLESAAKLSTPSLGEDNVIDGPFVRPMLPPPARPKTDGPKGDASPSKMAPKPPLSRGVPDYLTHPERWTKYSLDDVPETSDSRNRQVAQEYIQSLQRRRQEGSGDDARDPFTPAFNQDQFSSSDGKIVFSRPTQGSRVQLGSKVGEGKKKEVGLCHLEEEQEEEEGAIRMGAAEVRKKRKRGPEKGDDPEEEKPLAVGFNSNRKVNRKNFRKMPEKHEEDD